jgi:hypothetical protein
MYLEGIDAGQGLMSDTMVFVNGSYSMYLWICFSSVINRHSKSVRLSMYLEGINAGQGLLSDTLVLLMRVTRCIYGFELSILEERSLKYR